MASSSDKSLADRMTFPSAANGGSTSWADDTDEPSATGAPNTQSMNGAQQEMDNQHDGASEVQMGSSLLEPEFNVDVKLNDLQADPNNPLYSVKNFSDLQLPEALMKGLASLNFNKPSKIQERALPLLLATPPSNLIGQSQSGTGKTAAFVLNILARVDTSMPKAQALVLAPSRELARQILGVVQVMGQFMDGLKTWQAVPDQSQRGKTVEGHVVVGTPGTVMDLIRRRQLEPSQLKVLVLDEADNMLDQQGLGDQCKRVKGLIPQSVQTVLFSATFPDQVQGFAQIFAPNANQIFLQRDQLTVSGIKQMYLDVSSHEDKYGALVRFYGLMTIASSIIFVRTKATAEQLEQRMQSEGHQVACLTGNLEGSARDAVIDRFRGGSAKVLITTNVLARGIDVQSVTMVINYDVPDTPHGGADVETFLHRVGRTGRFGKVGVALTLISDRKSFLLYQDICLKLSIEPTKLDTDDWDNVERVVKQIIKSSRNAQSANASNAPTDGPEELMDNSAESATGW